jgi:hypothetical protein
MTQQRLGDTYGIIKGNWYQLSGGRSEKLLLQLRQDVELQIVCSTLGWG